MNSMTLRKWYNHNHPLLSLHGQPIRHIGLYQPFASLMIHGKIETRWVKKGKKPPFPLGIYLVYSTKKRYDLGEIMNISGQKGCDWMEQVLRGDNTVGLCGRVLCIGQLYMVHKMTKDIELECFVEYKESETHDLWALRFKGIRQLVPDEFKYGKQGIGFVPELEYDNILIKNNQQL